MSTMHSEGDKATRPLSAEEYRLCRWMLEHGFPDARSFLPQLDRARVTSWKCPCGCASINFSIEGMITPEKGGLHQLADFAFGESDGCGIFIYEIQGVLSGIEVCSCFDHAPKELPAIEALKEIWDPRDVFTLWSRDERGERIVLRQHVPQEEASRLLKELAVGANERNFWLEREKLPR